MNPRVIRRPRAVANLIEHYAYIARDRIEAADRFLKAAERTFELIGRYPMIGRAWESERPRLAGIRVYPMRRFRNYLVFYRPHKGAAEILTVIHAARDLGLTLDALRDDEV
jgi:toxin ParE1/3/4